MRLYRTCFDSTKPATLDKNQYIWAYSLLIQACLYCYPHHPERKSCVIEYGYFAITKDTQVEARLQSPLLAPEYTAQGEAYRISIAGEEREKQKKRPGKLRIHHLCLMSDWVMVQETQKSHKVALEKLQPPAPAGTITLILKNQTEVVE